MSFADLKAAILDGKTFVASCRYFKENCSASMVISAIAALFTVIGWEAMAPMAASISGITCFVPVFRLFLTPLLAPVFEGLATHRVMFAGTLLDPLMGGYAMAMKLAPNDYPMALYSSLVLGTMFGSALVFNIPVGMTMIREEHHIFFAFGTLIGIVSIPFGSVVGGLSMNITPFSLSAVAVFQNMIAVVVIAFVIGIPLYLKPFPSLKGFMYFSAVISFS
jgi:ethanolamine transporter